ncbi:MAG: dTDP-4-amino-4,6-dideoxygalactose transaminase [Myxococcota bacterium]
MIPFTKPTLAPGTLENIHTVLENGHVSGDGLFTRRASQQLTTLLGGSASVLLTTSCTHALEMIALLLGISPGDEVVLPSYTFSSTANAFRLRGARLRFADVDPTTFSMGPRQAEAAMTDRTVAVMAVHYGGVPEQVEALAALCQSRGVALVEDNAHGLLASVHGQPLGTFGRMSALSFHATKNISCGEGGALVLNAPEDDRLAAEILRDKGTDRSRYLRGEVDRYTWRGVGSSYLPSDLLAAVLVAQLDHADAIQRQRHALWQAYRRVLEPEAERLGIVLQRIPEGVAHPAHLFALLVPESVGREPILEQMRQAQIKATSHYEPLHRAPAHDGGEELPVTDALQRRLIRLPLFTELTVAQAEQIGQTLIASIEAALRHAAHKPCAKS